MTTDHPWITDAQAARALAERATPNEWRMTAYYYSFRRTGRALIDAILSAVARAGKGYHHTEHWSCEPYGDDPNETYIDLIQSAADEAAELVTLVPTLAKRLMAAMRCVDLLAPMVDDEPSLDEQIRAREALAALKAMETDDG